MNYNSEVEYLAVPYTHEHQTIMDYRADMSDKVAAKLVNEQDRLIFAPISSWHNIAKKYKLPTDYKYWLRLNEETLKNCKKLLVICLAGWKESVGVAAEIEIANKYNIPIDYLNSEGELINEIHN
jgi:hypothetical protein